MQRLTDGLELTQDERQGLEEALDETPQAAAVQPQAPPSIAWLSPGVPFFVGREEQLRDLDQLISHPEQAAEARAIAVVSGAPGVGKSTLAVHWGHRSAVAFPDGQLYLNLRGFDPSSPPVSPGDAVRVFLGALGVPAPRIPRDPVERVGLYRSLTSARRILIVIDNARDAEQVRPLLPGGAEARVVITSRNPMLGLVATDGALPVVLDVLTAGEARELLRRRLGPDRVDTHREAVSDIIARCACLPLALALVSARAATHPRHTLSDLAGELRHTADALDVIASDEPASDLRTVFSWSYRTLAPDTARVFRLLGLHQGPDISLDAVASLAGVSPPLARSLLGQLAAAGLIAEPVPGRFVLHDLLRAFAGGLSPQEPAEQRSARARLLDHYLVTAFAADRQMEPLRDAIDVAPPSDGVTVTPVPDRPAAQAWLEAELPVLVRTVSAAAAAGMDTHAWQLAWSLVTYLDVQGYLAHPAATQRIALAAARRLGNSDAEARALRQLANADIKQGNLGGADQYLAQALHVCAAHQDLAGQANTHLNIALLRELQERFSDANDHALQALDLFRAAGHRAGEGIALNSLGYGYALTGNLPLALQYCTEALTVTAEVGHEKSRAHTYDSLGYIHAQLGDFGTAAGYYREALELFRTLGDRFLEADAHIKLGDIARDAGDGPGARAAWTTAAGILDELNHPRADEVHELLRTAGPVKFL